MDWTRIPDLFNGTKFFIIAQVFVSDLGTSWNKIYADTAAPNSESFVASSLIPTSSTAESTNKARGILTGYVKPGDALRMYVSDGTVFSGRDSYTLRVTSYVAFKM